MTDKNKMRTLLVAALKEGLETIKEKVPVKDDGLFWFFKKHRDYPIVSYFNSGLPSFQLSEYEKRNFSAILSERDFAKSISSWKAYSDFILSDDQICKYFEIGSHSPEDRLGENNLEIYIIYNSIFTYYFLSHLTDTYIHRYGYEFNEIFCEQLFEKIYRSIFLEKSPIEIVVPIIFLRFDFNEINLTDSITIRRMDENFQKARNYRTSYTNSAHPVVVGAASHAIVLKFWDITNNKYEEREKALYEFSAYKSSQQTIDMLFAAIRIATGHETGYCQIIAKPYNWEFNPTADLEKIYVVSERNYPIHFENFGWLKEKEVLTSKHAERIKDVYSKIVALPMFELAIRRLNSACNRITEDDSIIDITIALESILTSDTKTEIGYRLATRAALLCKLEPFNNLSSELIFEMCKKIYDFRSTVVHGSIKKKKVIKTIKVTPEKEIEIVRYGIDFLAHIITVIAKRPEIKSVKDIDKLLHLK